MKQKMKRVALISFVIFLSVCFFACSKAPSFEMQGKKTFVCNQVTENIPDKSTVSLDFDKMTFTFSESMLSSRFNIGAFEFDRNKIVLTCDDDKDLRFVFTIDGDELVFDAKESSFTAFVADGTRWSLDEKSAETSEAE